MKKITLLMVCLLYGLLVLAQKNDTTKNKTLFKNPKHVGWYVGAHFDYTQISGDNAYLSGLSGGFVFDHVFTLGLAFYGILNSNELKYSDISPTQDLYLYGGYGGLKMEYILFPTKVVYVSFPLLIGGGGLSYQTGMQGNSNNESYASDGFFVLQPGVNVGVNLIRWMRFEVGISYRYAPEINLPNTSSDIMNAFNACSSLKFGKF